MTDRDTARLGTDPLHRVADPVRRRSLTRPRACAKIALGRTAVETGTAAVPKPRLPTYRSQQAHRHNPERLGALGMHAIQSKNKISDNLSGERFPIGAWLPECAPQLKAAPARRSSILEMGTVLLTSVELSGSWFCVLRSLSLKTARQPLYRVGVDAASRQSTRLSLEKRVSDPISR